MLLEKQLTIEAKMANLGIFYAHSDSRDGNMSPKLEPVSPEHAYANRIRFLENLGLDPQQTTVMRPVHGKNIRLVDSNTLKGARVPAEEDAPSDALITFEPNLPLMLNPADCAPIVMTNLPGRERFLALIHAGREGTELEIVKETMDYLAKQGFKDPSQFVVGFGPLIRCYKLDYIQTTDPNRWLEHLSVPIYKSERGTKIEPKIVVTRAVNSEKFRIQPEPIRKMYVDLLSANKSQLLDRGVLAENIVDTLSCTACDARDGFTYSHFVHDQAQSHRKNEFPKGRFAVVAQLRV